MRHTGDAPETGREAGTEPGQRDAATSRRTRLRVGGSALLLVVFVMTAAGGSLYFQRKEDTAERAALVLNEVMAELRTQDAAEGRASSGRVHPDVTRAAVDRSVAAVDDLLSRVVAMGGDASHLAEIREQQQTYRDLVMAEVALVESGDLADAATFADDEVGPAFDAVLGHVERRVEARTLAADGAQRTSDLGMVLSIAIALVGNSLLQRRLRVEEVRRDQAAVTEARYRSLVDRSADLVVVSDREGRLDYLSPAAERILGTPDGRASEGWRLHDGIDKEDRSVLDALLAAPDEGIRDVRLVDATGEPRNFQVQARDLTDDRSVGGIVLTFHDVTDQRELEAELTKRALHDPLTGLPNRSLFTHEIQLGLRNMRRSEVGLAVLLIDLDRFKEINDTLGHHVGDQVLSQIGPRLQQVLREQDTLARLGGDEFAVLLPGVGTAASGELVGRKIQEALEEPFVINGLDLHVEASIGVVVGGDHGDDQATLMQRADVAMYEAKRQGAGVVVYASSIDTNSPERLAVLSELRHAVEEDQLVLHFQPLVSLSTGEVEVAEALVRWNHPTRGLLAPADFVPAAEQTGLISVMTRHILERSLEQVRRWRQAGLTLPVSVNVSARNIADPRLVSDLSALLEQYDVPAYLLRLEITESAIIADPDRAAEVLAAVNRLGVGLAIDDFGAGYTSFAQLHGLRVSELKIDHSYVTVMDSHASSGVIVRSLIDLGHNLGLTVTAEGVESLTVMRALVKAGCDLAQGYLLTPALPADEFDAWVATWDAEAFLDQVRSSGTLDRA